MAGFFRYPGGKSKLRIPIINKIVCVKGKAREYREPFFGGGSIGLKLLETMELGFDRIWLNDKDPGIAALWSAVVKFPDELKSCVRGFKPSVAQFDDISKELLALDGGGIKLKNQVVDIGFKKLAIHQISYSGLGTKSGGPLGGREQKSDYKIDCRWSPEYICKKIDAVSSLLNRFDVCYSECTCVDFEEVVKCDYAKAVIYLDPPYYVKGGDLYQCPFDESDHVRLAEVLRNAEHEWILSYDKHERIEELYKDMADIEEIDGVKYSITASRSKTELLIAKK